jgi:hypothetical protein
MRLIMCSHSPPCPLATAPDRAAARLVAAHPEQGWSLLCNGVIAFEDGALLAPDGSVTRGGRSVVMPPASLRRMETGALSASVDVDIRRSGAPDRQVP